MKVFMVVNKGGDHTHDAHRREGLRALSLHLQVDIA